MAARPFDLLLLDFGGVCLLNPIEMHHVAEAKLGLAPGTFSWLGPLEPSTDELWQELTLGDGLREREYWTRRAADVGAAAGRPITLAQYMELLYEPPSDELIRPACTRVVDQAFAAGLSVSVLTNDLSAFHGPEWQAGISLLQRVDEVIDCSDTGILKPDPRAYQRAMEITGFGPDRILFVDDQPLSVEGAIEAGIEGLWFDIASPDRSWRRVADRMCLT